MPYTKRLLNAPRPSRSTCRLPGQQNGLESPKTGSTISDTENDVNVNGVRSFPGTPKSPRRSRSKSPNTTQPALNLSLETTFSIDHQQYPAALLAKYDVHRMIGDGNFAVVRQCVDRSTQDEYALKIIDKTKCKGKEHMIDNEISILRQVKHPNIVKLIEEYNTSSQLYLIMELVKGGDLFDAISSVSKYTERDASGMLLDLASALHYLHSLSIVHRDIKPENLLVIEHEDGSKSLKLCDFGLAVEVREPLYTVCGTPTYVAPEILSETGYNVKVDIWATGVITYILLCGFPPFMSDSNNQDELFDQILSGQFEYPDPYWKDVSTSAKDLINRMLQTDPLKRYTASQIVSHPWVAENSTLDNEKHITVAQKLNLHFRNTIQSATISPGIALMAVDTPYLSAY